MIWTTSFSPLFWSFGKNCVFASLFFDQWSFIVFSEVPARQLFILWEWSELTCLQFLDGQNARCENHFSILIHLRFEKSGWKKYILPNSGEMVSYHGRKWTITLSKSKLLITCNHDIHHLKLHQKPWETFTQDLSRDLKKMPKEKSFGMTWLWHAHTHTPLMPIGSTQDTFTYIWLQLNLERPRKLTCHLKRDHFKGGITSSNHQFSGDMLVFQGGKCN